MIINEVDQKIAQLEDIATEIIELKQKRNLRRPLLIEFCGSPKSGKSTTISSLNTFLKRNGFKTEVLIERSSVCPVKNKMHPFFNLWTLTSAISEIIKHVDQGTGNVDIIISDRGIFDSLCWFEWLNQNPSRNSHYLDDEHYKRLKNFILMDIWSEYLDIIYVFQIRPNTSIEREYANLLTKQPGNIMCESVLYEFSKATETVIKKYASRFRKLIKIETDTKDTDNKPNLVNYRVTLNILQILKELLIEKIGYIDVDIKDDLTYGKNPFDKIKLKQIEFDNRDKVEQSNYIQPIAIAVITNPERNRILVVKKSTKRTSKSSPESERILLYIGGHVRIEDYYISRDNKRLLSIIQKTLHREIQEEIGESFSIRNSTPFLIYTPDNPKSRKHLAVCFVIEIPLDDKKFRLLSDEFIMKTGKSLSGHIISATELRTGSYKFESWSEIILSDVLKGQKQVKLF